MLRLANPGSDLGTFVKIFNVLANVYGDGRVFSLDDATDTLVQNNLATSCGYMGDEAIARSRREDRSRDPLYNQLKMYSELLRLLGWIRPSTNSRQSFQITYFGLHVPKAGFTPQRLIRESLLGIALPSPGLDSKGDYKLRPFATFLRAMESLGGFLSRDEMIVGPLDLADDQDADSYTAMIATILRARKYGSIDKELKNLLARRSITAVTARNYTRFPIAALEWTGWAEKVRITLYRRPTPILKLTALGRADLAILMAGNDVRWADIEGRPHNVVDAYTELGFQQMLDRAGFDVSDRSRERAAAMATLSAIGVTNPIVVFSPYQQAPAAECDRIFSPPAPSVRHAQTESTPSMLAGTATPGLGRRGVAATPVFLQQNAEAVIPHQGPGLTAVNTARSRVGEDTRKVAMEMAQHYSRANKDVFYPLVADLFQIIGYHCEVSRAGVNYQRWDAFINDPVESIPIEIKSPGEEPVLSVKGIRQAFENKVILLARSRVSTKPETTSLVVGFGLPSDRAEVADLVQDIFTAFKVRIGVVGFQSLSLLAAESVINNRSPSRETINNLFGILDV